MNLPLLPIIISFLAPVLVLLMMFQLFAQFAGKSVRGTGWFIGVALVAAGLMLLPLQKLPLARWLAGAMDHWSVPLLALLVHEVVRRYFNVELLRPIDRRAASWFGVVAGIALYPLALGMGPFDPFSLGWRFGPLFAVMAVVTALLLWWQNRFGVVLMVAILAWHLNATESRNYWDCLLDPFYFLVSLVMLVSRLPTATRRLSKT